MGLFLDAAQAWSLLLPVKYQIILGLRKKTYEFELVFDPIDFPHLAGMQYARDVDFKVPAKYCSGTSLLPSLISGRLNDSLIESSRNWNRIEGRLRAIIGIQKTLDGVFSIYLFDPKKVSGYSKIASVYLIKGDDSGDTFFVFIDKENGRAYCKSAFMEESVDYSSNQSKLTLLKKVKTVNDEVVDSYTYPGYKAPL